MDAVHSSTGKPNEPHMKLEEYIDLYDSAPVAYLTLDRSSYIVRANLTAAKLLKVPRAGLIGKRLQHYVSPETQAVYNEFLDRAFNNHTRERSQAILLPEAGDRLCVQLEYMISRNDDNCLVTVTDITGLMRTEEALRESEERLREIMENSLDASYKRNLHTIAYDYMSPVITQLSGYTPDEFMNMPTETVINVIHPDDRAQVEDVITKSMSSTECAPYEVEYRFKHKDGDYRWFRDKFVITRDAKGLPAAMIGSVSDITKHKQIEDALHKVNGQLFNIIESSVDSIAMIDTDSRYILFNSAFHNGFKRIYGVDIKVGDLMPQVFAGIPYDIANAVEYWNRALAGEDFRVTQQFGDVKLERNWYELHFSPIRDSEGKVTGALHIVHNIIERKQAEQALARTAERDHHIAKLFQQIVMPRHIPIMPEGFEIATKYQPALQEADVCGDFFDIFDLGNGDIGISIGDIVGKGLSAAMRITAARNMIRSYAFLHDNPSKVMSLVNDALCRDIAMENDMLTAFYAVLDTHNNILTYCNAGHEPPLISHSSGKAELLQLGGLMFCGIGKQDYTEGRLSIQEGDTFVTVTDGITEAGIDRSSAHFGAEGIMHCISASASAEQTARAILEDATKFANGKLHDDASIVVIKKTG